jgi:hypothetical protein
VPGIEAAVGGDRAQAIRIGPAVRNERLQWCSMVKREAVQHEHGYTTRGSESLLQKVRFVHS